MICAPVSFMIGLSCRLSDEIDSGGDTAPSAAEDTVLAYLAITPRLIARRRRLVQPWRRAASSAAGNDRPASRRAATSISIDVAVAHGGNRSADRGLGGDVADQKPRVAPEKRPSVSSATDSPSPAPTIAAVTPSISRMPGPPFGPS